MKIKAYGLMLICTALVGCGSGDAPFGEEPIGSGTGDDGGIESSRELPPGTTSPQSDDSIFRSEPPGDAQADGDSGDGFARGISYNAETDVFVVDNLPFDGGADTPYNRGENVASFGPYAVYEAVSQYPDSFTSQPINQFTHRAIYGVSQSGETEFAIVRTGAYIGYGFGGFVYEREGGVDLPTSGQALYSGQAAGIRDFDGIGGLEYITAEVDIAIDFDDFNADTGRDEGAVNGFISNQRIFDINGADITSNVVGGINTEATASLTAIPAYTFVIEPGALDTNGEIAGSVISNFVNDAGEAVSYATGQYYGILSGENADELVGVVVVESGTELPNTTVRSTLGFTILR